MNPGGILACGLASFLVVACADAAAEKTGETITPSEASSCGFLVRIERRDGDMRLVSVKIAKEARSGLFAKHPAAVLLSAEFSLPLHVTAHSNGDRWVSFQMVKSMINRSKLLISNNDFDNHLHLCTFVLSDFPEAEPTPKETKP